MRHTLLLSGLVLLILGCGGLDDNQVVVVDGPKPEGPDWCLAIGAAEGAKECSVVAPGESGELADMEVSVLSARPGKGDADGDDYTAEKLAESDNDIVTVVMSMKNQSEDTAEPGFGMYFRSRDGSEHSNLSEPTKKLAGEKSWANLWDDREFEGGQNRKVPLVGAVPAAAHGELALVLDHTDDNEDTILLVFPLEVK